LAGGAFAAPAVASWGLAGLFLLALIPWPFSVDTHGLARAERQQLVFAPFPAELVELHAGGSVAAGATLAAFTTPDLLARQAQVLAGTQALERRLAGLLELDGGVNKQLALTQRLDEQHAELRGIAEETGRLAVQAEFAGQWRDVSPLLRPGTWLGVREALGVLIDPHSWVVDAYVEQRLVDRIEAGARVSFLPQNSVRALAGEVVAVDIQVARGYRTRCWTAAMAAASLPSPMAAKRRRARRSTVYASGCTMCPQKSVKCAAVCVLPASHVVWSGKASRGLWQRWYGKVGFEVFLWRG